jgi:hypothetical protein
MTVENEGAPDPELDKTPTPEIPAEQPAEPEKTAEPEKKEESALDAVRRALNTSRDQAERDAESKPDEPAKEPEPTDDTEKEADKADILTSEEFQKLPPRVRKRLGKLAADVKAERAAREALEPRAKFYDDVNNFVHSNKLTQAEFDEGLKIIALINRDPKAAYEALKPIYANLQRHMGEILPPDLQEQVDDGRVTPELAAQLVAERSQRELLEARQTQDYQVQQQQRADQDFEQRRLTAVKVIGDWEAGQRSADPEYARKAQAITDRATIMVQHEMPATAEALLDVMNRAKTAVDKQFPAPRRPLNPVNVPSANGQMRQEPKTALEAARLGLASVDR